MQDKSRCSENLKNVALRAPLLLRHEGSAGCVLKDFSDSLSGLGTAFKVSHCSNLIRDLLSL